MNKLSVMHALRSRRGLASALIIMILVLLIFFAVLGLVTSAADLRLARKRADWNQQFYVADTSAVELYAELDLYCAGLAPETLDQDNLHVALDVWLSNRDDVRDYLLTESSGVLQLDLVTTGITAGHDGTSQQGIAMTLLVKTGSVVPVGNQLAGRIEITQWAQWQEPFNYDAGNGGVWEG